MPGIWSDLAQWVGPTPNVGGPMVEQRGMILHIMQGSLAGSINWGKNPASGVSFHFGTRKSDGLVQQLVSTDVTAWTQGAGNGRWVSVENEDYSGIPLSGPQLESVSQLYARGVREYGWPYQLADTPSGRGLGWHGMGGAAWGGHYDCPGQPIVDQRPAILDRAKQINGVTPPTPPPTKEDTDMFRLIDIDGGQFIIMADPTAESSFSWKTYGASVDPQIRILAEAIPTIDARDPKYASFDINAWRPGSFGKSTVETRSKLIDDIAAKVLAGLPDGGDGVSLAQVEAAVRAQLDATKLGRIQD